MDEKVKYMLKLIDEDGDSFAKRAEMYYRKRPELISFVEEFYRAYRSLAERYDHISGELQNANHTIATVFPEQVQFAMDEEDDTGSPRASTRPSDPSKIPKELPQVPKAINPNYLKNLQKGKGGFPKKSTKEVQTKTNTTTGSSSKMSKKEAVEEIDKLQKGILALQTEKEFVKSSYESRLSKYWEIEKVITEMQATVSGLQDEYSAGTVIEDNEARTLMASTALKSCQETLVELQEKQERSTEEARVEFARMKTAQEKLKALKDEFQSPMDNYPSEREVIFDGPTSIDSEKEVPNVQQEILDPQVIREKIKDHFKMNSGPSVTVSELAEKIDELVTKVISLETAVSTQTALLKRLRTENDDFQEDLQSLEEDKATLLQDSNKLNEKLKLLEGELHAVQDLNRNVESQNSNLETHFTEAHCNLDHLSAKLKHVMPLEEEIEITVPPQAEAEVLLNVKQHKEHEEPENIAVISEDSVNEKEETARVEEEREEVPKVEEPGLCVNNQGEGLSEPIGRDDLEEVTEEIQESKQPDDVAKQCPSQPVSSDNPEEVAEEIREPKQPDDIESQDSSQTDDRALNSELQEQTADQEEDLPNWQKLFLSGIDDRERVLLTEYTAILRKYKDARKQLSEVQMKSQDSIYRAMRQIAELKSAMAIKDEETQSLHQKLKFFQLTSDGNYHPTESENPQQAKVHSMFELGSNLQSSSEPTLSFDHQQVPNILQDRNAEGTERPDASAPEVSPTEEEDAVKVIFIDEHLTVSTIEEKFRRDIDELLEENLEFWLRFSGLFHQIQKFQTAIEDLQAEYFKLKDSKKQEDSTSSKHNQSIKSDARPLYKHLREIQTELTVWLEQNLLLEDELKYRKASLTNIQDEIVNVLNSSSGVDAEFTSYQAAKFQGEVLNMQQENNKVAEELQAGLEHVKGLQVEIEKTLTQMNEELKLSGSRNNSPHHVIHSLSRTRIPLRSFIFGAKSKRQQKQSLFSCMSPALQKQYSDLHGGHNVHT
ncbi:hypothetical protein IFM89_010435 [Coptis chinensis]|uniref:NAB domain-containing protein n=1 Tax=Coptis chinensis TaxID=261450 RepID=A0A835M2T6_9MAGN|nr:hypothetical protein IFM89_010435 [Coptis chinensis]